MKNKLYRIEFYDKGIYEFENYREACKWAKETFGEKEFKLFRYKNYQVGRVKKDLSFTKEVERNTEFLTPPRDNGKKTK
jgi:hypothetical protein